MSFNQSYPKNTSNIRIFSIDGSSFALDIMTGMFVELDPIASDVLELCPNVTSRNALISSISGKYGEIATREAIDELESLESDGLFFSRDAPGSNPEDIGEEIHYLCLIVSNDCNLRCEYCYADTGKFGGKRSLMSLDVAKKAVDFFVEHSGNNKRLSLAFFGGEPLLNLKVIKDTVEYAEQVPGKEFDFAITTNGTLLTEDLIDYLKQHRFGVLVSIDGPPEVHDKQRAFPNGRGSYEVVSRNLLRLLQARNDGEIPCSVRGTFTRNNPNLVDTVFHLADLGCMDISVEPCVTDIPALQIRDEDLSDIKEEYTRFAKAYVDAISNGRNFSFFHFNKMMEQVRTPRLRTTPCSAARGYFAVSVDGNLYPCQKFVGMDDFVLGNIFEGVKRTDIIEQFVKASVNKKTKCRNCWAAFICGGGCHAYAVQYNGDILQPYGIECELMKHRIELAPYILSKLDRARYDRTQDAYERTKGNHPY